MGIFPIIMNIAQFWLIDSIVKASAIATVSQDVESTQDREPLFRVSAEGNDDHPPRLETANRGSFRHSASPLDSRDLEPRVNTSSQATTTIPDEPKSSASSSRGLVDAHAYPPSRSNSPSSDRSSAFNHKGPKSVNNLSKKD